MGASRRRNYYVQLLIVTLVGTVLLLGSRTNEPLGLDQLQRKRTSDGIILDPQPDDNPNDPLNWASWRRNAALLCLGWHCLVGGGQTPVLAAGFPDVANTYGVSIPTVALSTGMLQGGLKKTDREWLLTPGLRHRTLHVGYGNWLCHCFVSVLVARI